MLQACGERPEGLMTASCGAQESRAVQNGQPQVQQRHGGATQPWAATASGKAEPWHVLPRFRAEVRAHVLLLGQSPGLPSALICGDNANLGKRGSPRARVGGLRPSSAPHPIPGPGEKFSNCVSRTSLWDPGEAAKVGVWGASLPRQLYYFQIPELRVDEQEFLSHLVWCAKHCNFIFLLLNRISVLSSLSA